jgi:hypothetical protein
MNYINAIWIFLALFISFATSAQDLKKYQWKNRIILLKDIRFDSDKLQDQLDLLHVNTEKLEARDLLIFIVTDESVFDNSKIKTKLNSSSIIKKYGLADFNGLVLVGKDGGVKLKESFIVNPKTIYNLIDSMPMRQAEMRSSSKH